MTALGDIRRDFFFVRRIHEGRAWTCPRWHYPFEALEQAICAVIGGVVRRPNLPPKDVDEARYPDKIVVSVLWEKPEVTYPNGWPTACDAASGPSAPRYAVQACDGDRDAKLDLPWLTAIENEPDVEMVVQDAERPSEHMEVRLAAAFPVGGLPSEALATAASAFGLRATLLAGVRDLCRAAAATVPQQRDIPQHCQAIREKCSDERELNLGWMPFLGSWLEQHRMPEAPSPAQLLCNALGMNEDRL
ncbi:MAG: hypothetical protein ACPGUV_08295 [Polyangiales bacterium]